MAADYSVRNFHKIRFGQGGANNWDTSVGRSSVVKYAGTGLVEIWWSEAATPDVTATVTVTMDDPVLIMGNTLHVPAYIATGF